jgi:hypothetical protein
MFLSIHLYDDQALTAHALDGWPSLTARLLDALYLRKLIFFIFLPSDFLLFPSLAHLLHPFPAHLLLLSSALSCAELFRLVSQLSPCPICPQFLERKKKYLSYHSPLRKKKEKQISSPTSS